MLTFACLTEEVVGPLLAGPSRLAALECVGFNAAGISEFEWQLAAGRPILTSAGMDLASAAIVADWHRDVWYVVADAEGDRRTWTRAGTRPGCPLAALIFALGLAIVMRNFTARFAEQGVVWTSPLADGCCFAVAAPTSEVRVPPVCYMDDTAVPVAASSAVEFVGKVVLVASTLLEDTRRHDLELDFGEGKRRRCSAWPATAFVRGRSWWPTLRLF